MPADSICTASNDCSDPLSRQSNQGTLQVGKLPESGNESLRTLASGKTSDSARISREQSQAAPAPNIPGYEVMGCLGEGNMGTVYRARELKLNRLVALKLISLGPQPKPDEVLRFQIEAESLASIQHANVVQVYEVGEHQGQLFLAMELVEGSILESYLEEHDLSMREAASMAQKVATAVHALHLRGIVHRDLKPANILITADGVPKLADFGLAKRIETNSKLTREGMVVGTPCYMAPEQAEGKSWAVGPMADVFSLGIVLYEMLTGSPPFVGDSVLATLEMIRFEEAVPPSRSIKHVPRDLETICLKCLHKKPAQRYESAGELAADLGRYLRGEPVSARPLSCPERAVKWLRRHPALAASTLLIAISLTAGLCGAAWHHHTIRLERDATAEYFNLSEEAVEVLVTQAAEKPPAVTPHLQEKRRVILETALGFYQQLAGKQQRAGAASGAIAAAKVRQADCLRWLDRHGESEQVYQEAISILSHALADQQENEELNHTMAEALEGRGELHTRMRQFAQAESSFQSAIGLNKQLAGSHRHQTDYLADLAGNHNSLASCLRDQSQLPPARTHLNIAIQLLEGIIAQGNLHSRHVQNLAESHLELGMVLHRLEEHDQVESSYTRAMQLFEQLHGEHPDNAQYHTQLAQAATGLAEHHAVEGDLESAEEAYKRAHGALNELSRKHGVNQENSLPVASARQRLDSVRTQLQSNVKDQSPTEDSGKSR